ncbi:MAG: hypothetical protein FWG78_00945 [Coriobacteriia bacterium]|nr:hypothetical protein [Coriobacteriia bacterium]
MFAKYRTSILLATVALVALLVFSVVAYLRGPAEIVGDSLSYVAAAQRLITTGTFDMSREPSLEVIDGPTAWAMPGYTFFLVPLYLMSGVSDDFYANVHNVYPLIVGMQLVLAALSVAVLAGCGFLLQGNRGAFLVGVLGICYLPLAFNAAYIGTETLAFFLTSLVLLCALGLLQTSVGKRAILWACALGVVGGLLVLVRPSILPWLLVPTVFYVILNRTQLARALVIALACVACVGLVMSPWIVRNAVVFGEFIPLTSGSGHPLFASVSSDPITAEDEDFMQQAEARGEDGYRALAFQRLSARWHQDPVEFVLWKVETIGSAATRYPDTTFDAWVWKNTVWPAMDEAERVTFHAVEQADVKDPYSHFDRALRLWTAYYHRLLLVMAVFGFAVSLKKWEGWFLASLPVFFLLVHTYFVVEPRYLYYNVTAVVLLAMLGVYFCVDKLGALSGAGTRDED